tara:strand:- start:1056 stop:2462 length:1407 start_codon:yes stop_codon:yes gene_type:complete
MANYDPPFIGKTEDPASSGFLYNQRKYYKNTTKKIFDDINPNYIDLWYETPLYGKVDTNGNFVFPNDNKIVYPLMTDSSGKPNIVGFDFALKALEEYIVFLRRGFVGGKTGLNGLLNNFKVVSGYNNPFEAYRQYLGNVLSTYGFYLVKSGKNSEITNFNEYVCQLIRVLEVVGEKLTFFHYYTSHKTNLSSTGLSFRFIEEDQDDDYLKNKFYKHQEFAKYVNTAANFGFRINKNSPWEIIIDINSKPMLQNRKIKRKRRDLILQNKSTITTVPGYLQEKLIKTPAEFFNAYYENVMSQSYEYFRRLLLFSYAQYVEKMQYAVSYGKPYIVYDSMTDIISDKEFGRTAQKQITLEPFDRGKYDSIYFIKKYERILNIEFKNMLNKNKYNIFKNEFDRAVDKTRSSSAAYTLLDSFYSNLSKIYDPHTKKLIWQSPKNNLTGKTHRGKVQTKDQPTISKIVTEFMPDI